MESTLLYEFADWQGVRQNGFNVRQRGIPVKKAVPASGKPGRPRQNPASGCVQKK
jgi:hypothetical protein